MSDSQLAKQDQSLSYDKPSKRQSVKPRYEIDSSEDSYLVRVYTPGASRNSVHITHEKDMLTISAERKAHYSDDWKSISREIFVADYELRLQLNVAINEQGIAAKLENGILDVILPIAEEAKPRKIEIK